MYEEIWKLEHLHLPNIIRFGSWMCTIVIVCPLRFIVKHYYIIIKYLAICSWFCEAIRGCLNTGVSPSIALLYLHRQEANVKDYIYLIVGM